MIRVLTDGEAVSRAAAAEVAVRAAEAIELRGRFNLALAGGHTPQRLYEILGVEYRESIPWASVELFWGDERCVPPADDRSNYHLVRTTLLERVSISDSAVHRIPAELGAEAAAVAYEAELARTFGRPAPPAVADAARPTFDLTILGLGRDGHTASLFPGQVDPGDGQWARSVRAPAGIEPEERVTLTLRALNSSWQVLFLVVGEEKREALARVLAARDQLPAERGRRQSGPAPPAALVEAARGTSWLADQAAAGW